MVVLQLMQMKLSAPELKPFAFRCIGIITKYVKDLLSFVSIISLHIVNGEPRVFMPFYLLFVL